MPEKVLIANRGEIAVRIIRTLRQLGISSVVIHHRIDADSRAVRDADEAIQLEGSPPVAAYLNIAGIIDAARVSGASAIHPGFGFLAENAEFARAVAEAELTFIGPHPDAIAVMGDKIRARRLAHAVGIPTLPGTEDAVDGVHEALEAAEGIGYPILLKASAGGGGKGMRIARSADDCRRAFDLVSSEAEASFGDRRIFLERYVERPRHIEVQVLADSHGSVIHLGERECSIQRRYQKVIEEAPSPFVDAEMRREMGERAIALSREMEYLSAGTVEMVVDERGDFYFLEMNTRLQVEHPVTELVTGVDIVAEQLRIASGEPLSLTQDDVRLEGHAIECRLYAEDPAADFMPATGDVALLRFPSGPGLRIDHGLLERQTISAAFDPMIAKIVAHAHTREGAIDRLREALRNTVLLGPTTNAMYLERVLDHAAFRKGETYTSFLEEHADDLQASEPSDEDVRLLVAAGSLLSRRNDRRHEVQDPAASIGEWRP